LLVLGRLEFRGHIKQVKSLPIRIHINSIREEINILWHITDMQREVGIKTIALTTELIPDIFVLKEKNSRFVRRCVYIALNREINKSGTPNIGFPNNVSILGKS